MAILRFSAATGAAVLLFSTVLPFAATAYPEYSTPPASQSPTASKECDELEQQLEALKQTLDDDPFNTNPYSQQTFDLHFHRFTLNCDDSTTKFYNLYDYYIGNYKGKGPNDGVGACTRDPLFPDVPCPGEEDK